MALTDNLVFYVKLDESSGSIATDSIGSIAGTWQGSLGNQWTTGIINNGGSFNGTNNYLLFGTPSLGLSGNQPFSISYWVKPSAAALGAGPFDYGIFTSSERISLVYGGTSGSLLSSHFSNDHNFTTKVDFNQWNHLVLTYNGTTEKLYKNGTDTTESWTPTALTMSGGTLALGAGLTPTVMPGGAMDEVGFWSRAISSAEVGSLYNSGAGFQYPFATSTRIFGLNTLLMSN